MFDVNISINKNSNNGNINNNNNINDNDSIRSPQPKETIRINPKRKIIHNLILNDVDYYSIVQQKVGTIKKINIIKSKNY